MSAKVAIDNDVLIKCSCYDLLEELTITAGGPGTEGVLGLARYVVRHLIQRQDDVRDREGAAARFEAFMKEVEELEPSPDEVSLASRIEETALHEDLSLDEGESQLCAIVLVRGFRLLLSGDKRAIAAFEELLPLMNELDALRNKVACLEQFVLCVLARLGAVDLRSRVCAEPSADKAISICFSCSSTEAPAGLDGSGLESYIDDLRRKALNILCANEYVDAA